MREKMVICMKLQIIISLGLLFCLLCLNGVGTSRFLSLEEDLELEKELRRLNKPAAKSIKMEHGDMYDCVNFYKQPAFDHPLLQNHNFHFQMKPSSYPKGNIKKESSLSLSSSTTEPKNTTRKRLNCPFGTVPIRRTTKADLLRARTHNQTYFTLDNVPNTLNRHGLHVAIARTKLDAKKYYGGGMSISIEGPTAMASQYTMGQMKIQNVLELIQVGWMVNPTLYGDTETRFFIYLKTTSQFCFNVLCPGFVLVSSDHPVDECAGPISKSPGEIHSRLFIVFRDDPSGNWWLQRGDDEDCKQDLIGFWPQSLFISLRDQAAYVDWGGEAFSPEGMLSPPMGRESFPHGDVEVDALCSHLVTIDENHEVKDAEEIEVYVDKKEYYMAITEKMEDYGNLMVYGGPGGAKG